MSFIKFLKSLWPTETRETVLVTELKPADYYERVGLDGLTAHQRDFCQAMSGGIVPSTPYLVGEHVEESKIPVSRGFIAFHSEDFKPGFVPFESANPEEKVEDPNSAAAYKSALNELLDNLTAFTVAGLPKMVRLQGFVTLEEYRTLADLGGRDATLPRLGVRRPYQS